MQPRFTGTCLISQDVSALAVFYADLLDGTTSGDGVFTIVSTSGAVLSIYAASGMEQMAAGSMDGAGRGGFTVEFEVDDVDARHERLVKQGTAIVKRPTTQPWGRRSVWVRDPDGNLVNLYQTVPAHPAPETVAAEYFHALLVERDLSVCDRMLAEDYVDHDAPEGTPPGPGATRAFIEGMLTDYPDLEFTIDQIVALDRHVAVSGIWKGNGSATGVPLRQTGLVLLRLDESDRLAERRSVYSRD